MTAVDMLGLTFAFLALMGAGIFFWRQRVVAGLAFLVAFIVALAGVSQQRVVFSSAVLGVGVERSAPMPGLGKE
jgi:hypothetical protein